MSVTAVLLGLHRAFLPAAARSSGRVELRFPTTTVPLSRVVDELGMPPEMARIVLLDGEAITDDHLLRDGETVTFVSPIGGG